MTTADNEGALQEVRPRAVKGVGFGNIFSGGQINLRKPTVDKKSTSEANQPVPEPIKPSQVCYPLTRFIVFLGNGEEYVTLVADLFFGLFVPVYVCAG